MSIHHPSFRLIALVLAVALALTLATPARAEALEPMTILALVSIGVVVIIVVVYLIVANVHGSKMSQAESPVLVACLESDTAPRACWPLSPTAATLVSETVQGP